MHALIGRANVLAPFAQAMASAAMVVAAVGGAGGGLVALLSSRSHIQSVGAHDCPTVVSSGLHGGYPAQVPPKHSPTRSTKGHQPLQFMSVL